MERIIKETIVWMAVIMIGAIVFDGVLQLTGGWLMLGGVITYQGAAWLARRLGKSREEILLGIQERMSP